MKFFNCGFESFFFGWISYKCSFDVFNVFDILVAVHSIVRYRVGTHLPSSWETSRKYVWGITPRPDNGGISGTEDRLDMKPHAMCRNLRICKKVSE